LFVSYTCQAQERITNNMLVNISISGVPTDEKSRISAQYLVDGNGDLIMPLIEGKVEASGMSAPVLAVKLAGIYKDAGLYSSPVFTVTTFENNENEAALLREVQRLERERERERQEKIAETEVIYVTGHAKKPGKLKLTHEMTIRHALSECGEDGEWGSAERLVLKRGGKDFAYNYVDKPEVLDFKLKPGDFIDIPKGRGFSGKK
jgi:hypothetical protein